jgi:hypothetical protein
MYNVDSGLIVAFLLIVALAIMEIGFRLGHPTRHGHDDDSKGHVNATAASTLGIVGLLLAFTFSLALQRFDARSDAVVDEANAIGTAYLRAQLLPTPVRADVMKQLRDYVDARVAADSLSPVDQEWRSLLDQAARMQNTLWRSARRAAELEPNPVTSGLFIQSLNELIDSFGKREAALNRRVPDAVLWLMFATFVLSGLIVGYAAGVGGRRPSWVTFGMVALMAALVLVILDLDRPRRGLIRVSEKNLLELQAAIKDDPGAAGASPAASGVGR